MSPSATSCPSVKAISCTRPDTRAETVTLSRATVSPTASSVRAMSASPAFARTTGVGGSSRSSASASAVAPAGARPRAPASRNHRRSLRALRLRRAGWRTRWKAASSGVVSGRVRRGAIGGRGNRSHTRGGRDVASPDGDHRPDGPGRRCDGHRPVVSRAGSAPARRHQTYSAVAAFLVVRRRLAGFSASTSTGAGASSTSGSISGAPCGRGRCSWPAPSAWRRSWPRPSDSPARGPTSGGRPRGQVVMRLQVALQRLELLAVLEADQIVRRHRLLDRNRRHQRCGRCRFRLLGSIEIERGVDDADQGRQVVTRHMVLADIGLDDLSRQSPTRDVLTAVHLILSKFCEQIT